MSMKVSIIGSNSFVAKALIRKIVHNNEYELRLFGAGTKDEKNEFYLPEKPLNFDLLCDSDIIIFTAAAGFQANKTVSPDIIYEVNSFLPVRLSNYLFAREYKGKMITFGTYYEIGNNSELKYYSEIDVLSSTLPVPNHYCLSKRLLTRFADSGLDGINHIHLILPSLYSKDEPSHRLIPYIINSLKEKKELKLTDGEQVRQYLHVDDLSNLLEILFYKNMEPGIYNIAPADEVKIKDVVSYIFSILNAEPSIALGKIKRKDESMKVLLLDNSKIKNTTGWEAKIDLFDGIKSYLKN